MKQLLTLLIALGACINGLADGYSADVTVLPLKGKDKFELTAVISKLVEEKGRTVEKVISRPRIQTSPGVPASLYVGPSLKDPHYAKEENINVDVVWPKTGETGMVTCSVVIKRGDIAISRSKFQLQPGGN